MSSEITLHRLPFQRRGGALHAPAELLAGLGLVIMMSALAAQDQLLVTEFLAKNDAGLQDEDGDRSDWIEIFNADTHAVNLAGWFLTDNPAKLNKWPFPVTNLPPGRFLLVWASSKDRRLAGGPLHTNFKLDPNPGEYLALVRPDLTIASQFSPAYPPQVADISYGYALRATTNTLMGQGAPAKYLVPTNFALDAVWMGPGFDDSGWSNGLTPLGFAVGTNATPRWALLADSMADFSGIQGSNGWCYGYYNRTADGVPGYEAGDFGAFPNRGSGWSTSNYWTGTQWDYYGANPPYTTLGNNYWHPNGTNNSVEHWVIRRWIAPTNGLMRVDWWLAKQNVTCGSGVTGILFHNGAQKDTATVAYNNTNAVTRTLYLTNVQAGDVIDYALTPLGTDGQSGDPCDGSYGRMWVYSGACLTNFIATDLQSLMLSNNASVYLRVPFPVPDPSLLDTLLLQMNYNDGFVAYLNGQEVARRRAPVLSTGEVAASSTNDWSASGVQGQNNWFYGFYHASADMNGKYDPATDFNQADPAWSFNGTHWVLGLEDPPFTLIGQTLWHPNGTNSVANHWAIRRWLGQASGVVTARVSFAKAALGGSGVTLRVFLNGTLLTARTIGGTDSVGFTTNLVIAGLEAGDLLDFALDPLGTDGQTSDTSDLSTLGVVILTAPCADPAADSTATAAAAPSEAILGQVFDLTSYKNFLVAGTNVLAIHGLNVGAADPDFYIAPQVFGVVYTVNTNEGVYFPASTPGSLNGGGITNLGPVAGDIGFSASAGGQPRSNDLIMVTARIGQTFLPVESVTLTYRVMYSTEVSVAMSDDGAHGDGQAGDGVYGGVIPAGAAQACQMVRWFITTRDSGGNALRWPSYLTARSPQYFGTVIQDPAINTQTPVLHWFVQNPSAANTETGTRCSIYYNGQFLDNLEATLHGQSTSGFPKKGHNFNLNPGYKLVWNPNAPALSDFALLSTFADRSYMRNLLAADTYALTGTPGPFSLPMRVQQNGTFFALQNLIEQGNEDFLTRLGFDPNGALYKIYNTLNAVSPNEKKSREWEPAYDLQALINNVTQADASARVAYVYDHVNLPEVINFLAAKAVNSDHDCCHKNHYLYRDSDGTGEWFALPWDIDLCFGHVWTSTNGNYFDDTIYTNVPPFIGQNETLFGVIYSDAVLKSMWSRRIRTLMDQIVQPPGTATNADTLRLMIDTYANVLRDDAALDRARWPASNYTGSFAWRPAVAGPANPSSDFSTEINRLKDFFLPNRRAYLFINQVTNSPQLPQAQPTNALILLSALDYNPASGDQAQEYLELLNTNAYAVDISGWQVTGGVQFTFKAGTVMAATNRLYLSPDVKRFRQRTDGPRAGQRLLVVGPYRGQLSARGETLALVTAWGWTNQTLVYPGNPSLAQQFLRMTEIMYNPAPGGAFAAQEYEYLELKNISPHLAIDLRGVKFTSGVGFDFSTGAVANLGPGERVLVVRNSAAFTSRYGAGLPVAGQFTGALDSAGERLQLLDAANEEILDFVYDNRWQPLTDGVGFALAVVEEQAEPDAWSRPSQWRAGVLEDGSPGVAEPAFSPVVPVVVNECLSHTDPPQADAVELANPTTNTAMLGGWFLTDDFFTPKKYCLPAGASLEAAECRVFDSSELGFNFSSTGDSVFLFSADPNGRLTGYYHGFDFGAAQNGVSFGRHLNSAGEEDFVAQQAVTLGTNNAGPLVGPVVIRQIMYHPADLTTNPLSYVELYNRGETNVPLHHAGEPTNTWRLRHAVHFDFPTNLSLAPGGALLVVGFDPLTNASAGAAFRERYGLSTNLPIYGPWQGGLGNDEDTIELQIPDNPNTNGVPYVLVEKVHYRKAPPWPVAAAGFGAALVRRWPGTYANDATNWLAALPSPGTPLGSGQPPQILTQPPSGGQLLGQTLTLSLTATGDAPLVYQWAVNGTNLPGATNATLTIANAQRQHSGLYQAVVLNPYGGAASDPAAWLVQAPLALASTPTNRMAFPNQNVTLAVGVTGDAPAYQWRFNGEDIPGATQATLTITNLQPGHTGDYTVFVTNAVSSLLTAPATLTVLLHPLITVQPQSQASFPGSNITFSVAAISSTPLRYQWQFNGVAMPGATASTLTLVNVQEGDGGAYAVLVNDDFGSVLSVAARLDIKIKPAITVSLQPTNAVVLTGTPVTFSLTAAGSLPISFRWRKNVLTTLTNAILYENDCHYAIAAAAFSHAGMYEVIITNLYGSSASIPKAYLTVMNPLEDIRTRPGSNAIFQLVITNYSGTVPPTLVLKYQWWYNLTNPISGQTNTILALNNVQPPDGGLYTIVGTNLVGTVASQTAWLVVGDPPLILQQPASQTRWAGETADFSVVAEGSNPLFYQWYKNGSAMVGITNSAFRLQPLASSDAGAYEVVVTNASGAVTSQVATLTVLRPLAILESPTNQAVVVGATAAFFVVADGEPPLSYQWVLNQTNWLDTATNASLVLSNVSLADAGAYQVVVTNVTGSVTSEAAMLVVADLDRDQDGLPDDWERAHHLDPESAADAAQDSDGDGLTNWQEYVAGTDPQDPASVLKVLSLILPSGGPSSAEPLTLVFPAIAGKTYSVLYIPSPLSTSWHVLTSIVNLATDQCVTVQDSNLNLQTKRFYRITTPAVP